MNDARNPVDAGRRLVAEVLEPMKRSFVGKDEIVDLLGVTLVAGENLFILGPPGTAKSALVHDLGQRLRGRTFDYLLTRFTEPNEIFGPFDIRELREGNLVTNTEGMLPEASLVFLDELLNANSAILNSLLTVLNERIFRRGRETVRLPLLMVVGAGNHLPDDDTLAALFDRFLLRVTSDYVPPETLAAVLAAGWQLELGSREREATVSIEDVRSLHRLLPSVDVASVRPQHVQLVGRLRQAGIPLSDRRSVKLQRLAAASALLCGRKRASVADLWVLRYTWETLEQVEVIRALVQDFIEQRDEAKLEDQPEHPRARTADAPDPEALGRDLEQIAKRLDDDNVEAAERACLRDQLSVLAGRCHWVENPLGRDELLARVGALLRAPVADLDTAEITETNTTETDTEAHA